MGQANNLKVQALQTNLIVFAQPFVGIPNGPILATHGRYFYTRKALAGDVAHPQPQHQAGACGALNATPAWLPILGERPLEPLSARPA